MGFQDDLFSEVLAAEIELVDDVAGSFRMLDNFATTSEDKLSTSRQIPPQQALFNGCVLIVPLADIIRDLLSPEDGPAELESDVGTCSAIFDHIRAEDEVGQDIG